MNCLLKSVNFIHTIKSFSCLLYQELKRTLFCHHLKSLEKSYFLYFDKDKSFTIKNDIVVYSDGKYIYINDIIINENNITIYDNDYEYPYTISREIPDYFDSRQKKLQNPFLSVIVNDKECKLDEYLSVYKRLPRTNIEDWFPVEDDFEKIECITILGEEVEYQKDERLTLI